MRKVIGIPGYTGKDSNNFGVGNHHLEFVSKFGDARIIMPWEEKADIDLLYLPGGLDTAPRNYGAVPAYTTSAQDVFKEHFFLNNLKNYIIQILTGRIYYESFIVYIVFNLFRITLSITIKD